MQFLYPSASVWLSSADDWGDQAPKLTCLLESILLADLFKLLTVTSLLSSSLVPAKLTMRFYLLYSLVCPVLSPLVVTKLHSILVFIVQLASIM